MSDRRKFRILLTLFLIIGIATSGIMAEACLCGDACLHGLQPKGEKRVSDTFHKRCSETGCKSCSLENGWTYKATNFSSSKVSLKFFSATSIISTSMMEHSVNCALNTIGAPIYSAQRHPFSPSYLKHRVLLL